MPGKGRQHGPDGLTDFERRFVEGYLIEANGPKACAHAGSTARGASARSLASATLARPHVAAALAKAQQARSERTQITADRVLEELARIGFADIRRLFTWDEDRAAYVPSRDLTEAEAAVISEVHAKTTHYTREDGTRETKIELKLKTYDKLAALAKLGQHLGLFKDQIEVTVIDRLKQLAPDQLERLEGMSDDEIRRELPKLLAE